MCGHYLVSESESFQGCARNVRKRASQQGIQWEKRGRGKLYFPPLPVSLQPHPIPFMSSSAWRKCTSRSSYSLTWKERVPHTCKKTQSCLRSRLITPKMLSELTCETLFWLNLRKIKYIREFKLSK